MTPRPPTNPDPPTTQNINTHKQARDALEEYKVVVLVHDADAPRLSQRLQLKATLQAAGWDVWGPGTSTSRLVRDRDALVPVLVFCQDDATTLDRARFLVRAGASRRPGGRDVKRRELTAKRMDLCMNHNPISRTHRPAP